MSLGATTPGRLLRQRQDRRRVTRTAAQRLVVWKRLPAVRADVVGDVTRGVAGWTEPEVARGIAHTTPYRPLPYGRFVAWNV